jgi:DNA helicase II / ATP-dependent DNA helicase PcrA
VLPSPQTLLSTLNAEQRQAVEWKGQHALVLAGAGSGKTRVLTTRLAWLMGQEHSSAHGLMAVTFTNKAAKELQTRVEALLGHVTKRLWIGTFHGLAHRLLRYHAEAVQLSPQFQIIDESDQKSLLKRLYRDQQWDEKSFPMQRLLRFIQALKEKGDVHPQKVEEEAGKDQWLVEGFNFYQALCRQESLVDFPELLIRSIILLREHPAIAHHYTNRFQHILVDEFQDIAPLQYAWMKNLSSSTTSIMAVGDDDQTIYGFRGASVEGMQRFLLEYAPVQLFKLEQNYRSMGTILDGANAVITHNSSRLGKALWTQQSAGEAIKITVAESEESEARGMVRWIQQALQAGCSASDIAILYRTNVQSRTFEQALMQARIPYRVYGGMRFFERAEIRLAIAYLRVAQSPSDSAALFRMMSTPSRGIGEKTIQSIQQYAHERGVSSWQAIQSLSKEPGRSAKALVRFVTEVNTLLNTAKQTPFPHSVSAIIEASGLIEHYRNKAEDERVEHLYALSTSALSFNPETWRLMDPEAPFVEDLALFLGQASLDGEDSSRDVTQESIQLMTIHAAKGLEFKRVAVVGLEEGLFPHENCLANEIEEERRLMYVAMTRAREQLVLSYALTRSVFGQLRYGLPSRFLKEIPSALTEHYQISQWGDWLKNLAIPSDKNAYPIDSDYSETAAPSQSSESSVWKKGQPIFHNTLGEGIILKIEQMGHFSRLQIRFKRHGEKWLDSRYAPLAAV